jgi:hypothetical protein
MFELKGFVIRLSPEFAEVSRTSSIVRQAVSEHPEHDPVPTVAVFRRTRLTP